MPIGAPCQVPDPKSGRKPVPRPMLVSSAVELASTAAADTSVFHALPAGNATAPFKAALTPVPAPLKLPNTVLPLPVPAVGAGAGAGATPVDAAAPPPPPQAASHKADKPARLKRRRSGDRGSDEAASERDAGRGAGTRNVIPTVWREGG